MPGERLLLIAQSPVLQTGIQSIFMGAVAVDRVFEAYGALDAFGVVSASDPTLIVIQDSLPGVTGFVTAHMMRQLEADAKIVILSDRQRESDLARACLLGADALIPASIDPRGFLRTVRDVLAGDTRRSDHLVTQADEAWSEQVKRLTARELAVLDGVVRSMSPSDMAGLMHLPESAVRAALSSLVGKLGAADLTIAMVTAIRRGIIDLSGHLPAQEPERETVIPAAG